MNLQIYSQPGCSACESAKTFLKDKGIPYQELILNVGQVQEEGKTYVPVTHLRERIPTARSVPQIFDGRHHIGGLKELQQYVQRKAAA